MKITHAQASDAKALLALQKQAYLSEAALHDDYDIPPLTQTLEQLQQEFKDKTFLKIEINGQLVASGQVVLKGELAHIGRMAVCPDHQGLGIGSKLMAALEGVHPTARGFELFTGENSSRNLGMYQRRGYQQVGTQKLGKTTVVILRKQNPHVNQQHDTSPR